MARLRVSESRRTRGGSTSACTCGMRPQSTKVGAEGLPDTTEAREHQGNVALNLQLGMSGTGDPSLQSLKDAKLPSTGPWELCRVSIPYQFQGQQATPA